MLIFLVRDVTNRVSNDIPLKKEKEKKERIVVFMLAARRAVAFTIETSFQQAVFEGDSESVIKSLRGSGMENSLGGHIIKDILFYANSLQIFFSSHLLGKVMLLYTP